LNLRAEKLKAEARQKARSTLVSGRPRQQAQDIGNEARKELAQIKRQVRQLEQQKNNTAPPRKVSGSHYAMGVAEGTPADCKINIRGEARQLGSPVERGFLQVVAVQNPPEIADRSSGRLELAQWLTRPDHPLTARVMVNRVWHHLFGRGLVATVDNFGATGERPTHPELLDHLALRFMDEGWSVKAMVRGLVLSRTYRLANLNQDGSEAKDPENLLLGRMNMRRLEAEALRDAMLFASGQLDLRRPESSPVMGMNLAEIGRRGGSPDLSQSTHRSVYLPVLRNFLPDLFDAFDFAEPSSVMGRRDVTTVSTQALFMMNNPFVLAQARAMAESLLQETSASENDRVSMAYLRILGRPATAGETQRALEFMGELSESGAHPSARAWAGFCQALFASAEFRYLK
jgi:hypothetical protein